MAWTCAIYEMSVLLRRTNQQIIGSPRVPLMTRVILHSDYGCDGAGSAFGTFAAADRSWNTARTDCLRTATRGEICHICGVILANRKKMQGSAIPSTPLVFTLSLIHHR